LAAVNIHAAKTHLSRLVDRAAAGEEIVIAKNGKPLAKLVPYREERKPRVGGSMRGLIVLPDNFPEDFDAPLPDDLLALFYGATEEDEMSEPAS
jgi:prevent-host-death family protein